MFNVLFVCTENTCRSPMAQAILKHLLKEIKVKNVNVKSCGIMVNNFSKLSPNSRQVLNEMGLKIRHKPQQITQNLVNNADLILTMTLEHKIDLSLKYDILNKLFTFAEFTGGQDVIDPYGKSLNEYRLTGTIIYNNCVLLIRKLIKEGIINV